MAGHVCNFNPHNPPMDDNNNNNYYYIPLNTNGQSWSTPVKPWTAVEPASARLFDNRPSLCSYKLIVAMGYGAQLNRITSSIKVQLSWRYWGLTTIHHHRKQHQHHGIIHVVLPPADHDGYPGVKLLFVRCWLPGWAQGLG